MAHKNAYFEEHIVTSEVQEVKYNYTQLVYKNNEDSSVSDGYWDLANKISWAVGNMMYSTFLSKLLGQTSAQTQGSWRP